MNRLKNLLRKNKERFGSNLDFCRRLNGNHLGQSGERDGPRVLQEGEGKSLVGLRSNGLKRESNRDIRVLALTSFVVDDACGGHWFGNGVRLNDGELLISHEESSASESGTEEGLWIKVEPSAT